jgi:nucleotide-binding universal stress UspA family protein
MAMKSIIALASGDDSDAPLLSVAAKLAAHFKGRLRVQPAFGDPAADLVFYGTTLGHATPAMVERVNASLKEAQAKLESIGRDVAAAQRLPAGALVVEERALLPASALASAAALADLVAFGGPAVRSPTVAGIFAEALIGMRAPCLIVNGPRYDFNVVAIAWDGSVQAGRAVRAALPLIKAAGRVVVLQNTDDGGLDPDDAAVAPLTSYLELNGVADLSTRTVRGSAVAPSLLAGAQSEQCDLLVAGGYGRPRFYELALGGTTRSLVNAEKNAPHLFLAH